MSSYPNIAGTMGHKPEQKFRGCWSPQISTPQPRQFYKVAPPAQPAKKKAEPPPPPLPPRDPKLTSPDRECKYNIRDRNNDYRSCITDDGSCYNNAGELIGYISGTEAGSPQSEFLGQIRSDNVVENAVGEIVGSLDPGKATIMNAIGSTIAELQGTGEVRGNGSTFLGQFEPFDYHDMKTIALYVLLVDSGFTNEIEG